MTTKLLFIGGSLNQTTMMHQIASQLKECECWFTPFYTDGLLGSLSRKGALDFSILGGRHKKETETYFAQMCLPVDPGGRSREYDLVLTCTDLVIPGNLRGRRLVLVQEGITEPEGWMYHAVRRLKLPRVLANTAATGLSDAYDFFCVASQGYRDLFIQKGVRPEKIVVTGIPNFDNAVASHQNNFPHRNYVLATTSSARKPFKHENRIAFIQKAHQISAGRKLIFKLHPNEDGKKASREIRRYAPQSLIYTQGDVKTMIAHCDMLVTEYSSVVFYGLALGKEIHSDFDLEALRRLLPIQNGGESSRNIADVCRYLLQAHQPYPETDRPALLKFDRRIQNASG